MRTRLSDRGFAALEAVLVIIAIAIAGLIGYYVWHANQQATATLDAASKTAQSSPPKITAAKKYFAVEEWGVRAPYTSTDTYSYVLSSPNLATVTSDRLEKNYDCKDEGAGQIKRLVGTDGSEEGGTGPTVAEAAAKDPARYTKIGNYYFQFVHDQAACSAKVTATVQNQANDFTKSLVSKLEAVPAS